jgi:hypothetical protein
VNQFRFPYEADAPGSNAWEVTPDDDEFLPRASRGIYVGGSGTLKVEMRGIGTVTFQAVPAGMILPIRIIKVYATGTSATGIISLA